VVIIANGFPIGDEFHASSSAVWVLWMQQVLLLAGLAELLS